MIFFTNITLDILKSLVLIVILLILNTCIYIYILYLASVTMGDNSPSDAQNIELFKFVQSFVNECGHFSGKS